MLSSFFEIRTCSSCGLRYPLIEGHSFGERCPHCLGETKAVLKKQLVNETIYREKNPGPRNAVLLDNIRSAWNVGSILRSADGFGFDHAYLCGITPTPENEAVRKTSLGSENYVNWSYHKDGFELTKSLKTEGWKIWAVEEGVKSEAIQIAHAPEEKTNVILVVGNEITGIDPELLDVADKVVSIPMRGQKRSLNVAIAFGVAAFAVGNLQDERDV